MIGYCLQNKAYVPMRTLLCKIHCRSFICFCKPSPHLYTVGPLKLESSLHVPSTIVVSVNDDDSTHNDTTDHGVGLGGESNEVKEESAVDGQEEEKQGGLDCRKSSLRKAKPDSDKDQKMKKKVQWVDLIGKELVEIREYEPSEVEDINYGGGRSCVCVIM